MTQLDDAKKVAGLYITEVKATLAIRQHFNELVVTRSASLFLAFKDDKLALAKLKEALGHSKVDSSALYKPLLVQLNGIFENYIRDLVKAVVEERYEVKNTYSELTQTFRNSHAAKAAKVLAHIGAGHLQGVPYNFDPLLNNLGKSFSNQQGFKLNHEIYTKLMGNCTSERLEELFKALELPSPFSDGIGNNSLLKAYFGTGQKKVAADKVSDELDRQIRARNNVVHGDVTKSVDSTTLEEAIKFFEALISALDGVVAGTPA